MSRQYPYEYSRKRLKNLFTCIVCKKQKEIGWELEMQYGWSRSDDEYEKICDECLKASEDKKKAKEEAYAKKMKPIWAERAKKEAEQKKRLESKYNIKYFTSYQFRVNGVLDIFPTNELYHDIKKNHRGSYRNLEGFLESFFKDKA